MAMLKSCEVYFLRADPKRPNARYNKANPTWEVQIRTSDVAQKKEWELHGLNPKLIVYPKNHEQEGMPILIDGKKVWRTTIKKKSITKAGEPASPIEVVGGNLQPIDPNSVGNGSIGNVRIFQYNFLKNGEPAVANVFIGIQVTKHIKRKVRVYEDFEESDMEVIEEPDDDGDDDQFENPPVNATTTGGVGVSTMGSPSVAPKPPVQLPDQHPEDAFK